MGPRRGQRLRAPHDDATRTRTRPPHEVILNIAYGDHQVTNWATLVEARTVGARLRDTGARAGARPRRRRRVLRHPDDPRRSRPTGSLLGVWDVGPLRQVDGRTKGTPPPPVGNIPNREGVDPHGPDASEQASGRAQVGAFLRPDAESRIVDACGDRPCYLDGWAGE